MERGRFDMVLSNCNKDKTLDEKIKDLITEWKYAKFYNDIDRYADLSCKIRDLVKQESNYNDGYSDGVWDVIDAAKELGIKKHEEGEDGQD